MELKDAIYTRRSVRNFIDRPIEDAILRKIIDAGLWAPSGVNLQPWYFVAIKSGQNRRKLLDIMGDVADGNRAHLEKRFRNHPEIAESSLKYIRDLGNAPVVILAFRDKPDYSYALLDEGIVQSIAAAMENILLMARDFGIYGCWMTAPNQAAKGAEMRDIFAPGHGELVCMAALGYPEEGRIPPPPERRRDKFVII